MTIALLLSGCPGEPRPSRLEGSFEGLVGDVAKPFTASFSSLSAGGVDYSREDLAFVLMPLASLQGDTGFDAPVVGLRLSGLPPMLLWAGPATFPQLEVARQDESVLSKVEEAQGTFTFERFEVTEDPHMPFVVRGSLVASIQEPPAGEGVPVDGLRVLESAFVLGADCSPEGSQDAHLCGEPVAYAQFFGMGTDQTDCPIELVRHFIGSSVNVRVDVGEEGVRTLVIGDTGAPFACVPTEREPEKPEHPRFICHAAADGLVQGGCTWNALAVATPTARYVTISARAVGACEKAVCNAIKF